MDPLSAIKADVLRRIEQHGFTAIYVGPDEEKQPHAYTVGLCAKTKDQREIIVLGLPPDAAIHVLNIIGQRLVDGEELPLRKDIDGIFEGFPARLVPVNAKKAGDYIRVANWYAKDVLKRDRRLQALQLLWPDRFGMWPGTPGATHRRSQPLI